jgi:bacillolysin
MSLAETHMGHRAQALGTAQLILLPIDGRLRLTYSFWCDTIDPFALKRYYVDAHTGEIAFSHNDLKKSAAIGTGTGTWGDHKLSVDHVGSRYEAVDRGRPAVIKTYDARGASDIETRPSVWPSYLARDDDNQWTNKSVVDGHAYLGWIYDYFYKRHGRRGLDDANKQVDVMVNSGDAGDCNAHWMPSYEVFGFSGPGNQSGGTCEAQVSGLDIVAHEYAHAVTEFSWNGVYAGQSGALNEAFSDIMGASVEFFFEPRGDGRNKADWYLGEDADTIFNPAGSRVLRSFANPGMFLWSGYPYPDHMSEYWDTGEADNGGVHYNCTIPSHAFYLFVEGGKNRTSGITVQGIGFANIEKAEKIFYRGFTKYMPQTATFYGAAYYTVIAAQELYGSNSNEANQLYQAWRAVGVVD